jgi:hypothetical protein
MFNAEQYCHITLFFNFYFYVFAEIDFEILGNHLFYVLLTVRLDIIV